MKRNTKQLSEKQFDLLVIGGGIYGLFVAWEAILRGLSVALVEKGDFGEGTSANTLRVIHGGLRYLQHGDILRMRQSILERRSFMKIVPHLVHPLPFLIPTYGHLMRGKEILGLALLINEMVAFDRNTLGDPQKRLPAGRIISRNDCRQLFPGVETKGLTGGAVYYDCQMFNSERIGLAVARSAYNAGAVLANYVKVKELLREKDRVCGVKVRDVLTSDDFEIRSRFVVNTSGPWLNHTLGLLAGHRSSLGVTLSKAFNLLINRQIVSDYAVGIYSRADYTDQDAILSKGYRLHFITPWRDKSLIGTAHLPYDADPDNLMVTEEEIHAFLNEINGACPAANLKREDVSFVFGGLLPMVGGAPSNGHVRLEKNYRIHDLDKEEGISGLISVMGVKFTESRHVAEKTVNLLFRKLGKSPVPSVSAKTPLYGGDIPRFNEFMADAIEKRPSSIGDKTIRQIIHHYGSAYPEVLRCIHENPEHAVIISEGSNVIKAQIVHAVREEMAQKLTDVMLRRTDIGIYDPPGDDVLLTCAGIMSKEAGWSDQRIQEEISEAKAVFSVKT